MGARTGITEELLDFIVQDLVTAGLVERHADDVGLVMLTNKGWELVSK